MDLINLLPGYYEENVTMQLLQEILSDETNKLDEEMMAAVHECAAMTSSKLLKRYEEIFGLETEAGKSDAFRRERIAAKISGRGTTTKAMLKDIASRYSNGDVEVLEDNAKNKFTIKFVGTLGIPGNMDDLKKTIEEIKPAHLEVNYEYVYNTWNDVGALTWDQAASYTWEGIRTVRINADNN